MTRPAPGAGCTHQGDGSLQRGQGSASGGSGWWPVAGWCGRVAGRWPVGA
jgi:hypothetical protein